GQQQRDQTTGQSQRQQDQQAQPQRQQRDQTQGQAPQRQQGQQGQTGQQGQSQQGQAQQGPAGSSVSLTAEQRTKSRQTVLAGGNVPSRSTWAPRCRRAYAWSKSPRSSWISIRSGGDSGTLWSATRSSSWIVATRSLQYSRSDWNKELRVGRSPLG